jgi:hypothetical protein
MTKMKPFRQAGLAGLLFSVLATCPQAAWAQVPDAEMARCARVSDPVQRLACLDALAAGAVARLEPAAQAAQQTRAQAANFGLPAQAPATNAELIETEIEGWVGDWNERTQFRLKNGQVWRVSDGSSGDVGLRNPKVTVRRNVLGTYFLEFAGRNGSPKVRRVQ